MKKFAIFKAGKHKDSKGNEKEYTPEDLDAIVTKYNNQEQSSFHEAPIVIGHPKSNAPAFGWISKLERIKDLVYAVPTKVANEFEEWVKKGLYQKVSVSLYPDLTLRHVGFLGAQPPAIKGLPAIDFSESEELIVIEFSEGVVPYVESRFRSIGRLFQSIRDYFIEKEGLETADKLINTWDIEDVKRDLPTPEDMKYQEPEPTGKADQGLNSSQNTTNYKEGQLNELEEMKKKNEALEAENKRLQDEKAKDSRKLKMKEFSDFCEKNLKKKIAPAKMPAVIDFMVILDEKETFEFSEGEGKTVTKNTVDEFKSLLTGLPDVVDFEEFASGKRADKNSQTEPNEFSEYGEVDPDRLQIDINAKKLMASEKISYPEAVSRAMKMGGK